VLLQRGERARPRVEKGRMRFRRRRLELQSRAGELVVGVEAPSRRIIWWKCRGES
jgi:hypothetical protein